MKIVIVEDDPGIRKELKQLLENAFYEAEIIEEFKDTAEQICHRDLRFFSIPGCRKYNCHLSVPTDLKIHITVFICP